MPAARALALLALAACGGKGAAAPDAAIAACSLDAAVDARTACAADAGCDVFLHCGCGASDKCSVGTVGLACGAAGSRQPGDECTTDGDCARGSLCATFAGSLRCLRYCDAAHLCPSGEACYVTVTDREAPPRALAEVCGPTCSLLAQDCPSSLACYVSDRQCAAERGLCLLTGSFGQGTSCARMSDCASGFLCIDPGGPQAPICAKICDRKGSGPPCTEGTSCGALPGHTQTGVCLP